MGNTRNHFQRRAFAGAIAAQKSHRFAFSDFKGKIVAGIHATKEHALLLIVEDTQEARFVILVQVVGFSYVAKANYHFVAHTSFMQVLCVTEIGLLFVRGHRPPLR